MEFIAENWLDILVISFVVVLLIIGIIGCFVPVMPGPPISYGALLVFHFLSSYNISEKTLWLWVFIVIAVTIFDLWVQIYGVKRFGGTKKAVNGSIIGLLIGIFVLPPFGVIIGPFIGAFVGARIDDPNIKKALKIALGALAGFLLGTLVKLIVCLSIIYIIFESFFSC